MGDLLLCTEASASVPFYIEESALNIYSCEELCWYMLHDTVLLDESFVSAELVFWIRHECGRTALAEKLDMIREKEDPLPEFAAAILEDTGYTTSAENREIDRTIRSMSRISDMERRKIRGDLFLQKEQFISAVHEYKRILNSGEIASSAGPVAGKVWHNLGTANAGLFLFKEAAECYGKAYAANHDSQSLHQQLLAELCAGDEECFVRTAAAFGVEKRTMQELRSAYSKAKNSRPVTDFELEWESLTRQKKEKPAAVYGKMHELAADCKDDYRQKSR